MSYPTACDALNTELAGGWQPGRIYEVILPAGADAALRERVFRVLSGVPAGVKRSIPNFHGGVDGECADAVMQAGRRGGPPIFWFATLPREPATPPHPFVHEPEGQAVARALDMRRWTLWVRHYVSRSTAAPLVIIREDGNDGGNALRFYASVRMRVFVDGEADALCAKTVKNKLAMPFRTITLEAP